MKVQGFVIEFIISAVLVLVVFGAAADEEASFAFHSCFIIFANTVVGKVWLLPREKTFPVHPCSKHTGCFFYWSRPSLKSWTVPFPKFGQGTIMKNQSKEKLMMVITSEHIQYGSDRSQPPGSFFPSKNAFWASVYSQTGMSGSFPTYQSCAKIIEPEKNILWVAWTLRCFQYIFIRWISLLQALPFSMCWAEPVNFFIGWVQFHT